MYPDELVTTELAEGFAGVFTMLVQCFHCLPKVGVADPFAILEIAFPPVLEKSEPKPLVQFINDVLIWLLLFHSQVSICMFINNAAKMKANPRD